MANQEKHVVARISGLILIVIALCPQPAHSSEELVGFRISIGVEFETEEVAIPGWEGGPIFEPKGYGLITIHAGFAAEGGAAEVTSATVTLKRYEGVGPSCTLRIPSGVIDRVFAPVLVKHVVWNTQRNTMHISADVEYPDYEMAVGVTCPPLGEVKVPDRPLYKIFGAFTDNHDASFHGVSVQLNGQPVASRTIKDLHFGEPMVYRATVDIVVERTDDT
jgi:hypothetical protein